jgi:hypothetical protein
MGPLSVLSILGAIWPRLTAIATVGLLAFPHQAESVFWWAVHVEGAHIASILDRMLQHAREAGAPRSCAASIVHCSRHAGHASA